MMRDKIKKQREDAMEERMKIIIGGAQHLIGARCGC
jgi:hypothetical protein